MYIVLQWSVPNPETYHFLPSIQTTGPVSWLFSFFCWALSEKQKSERVFCKLSVVGSFYSLLAYYLTNWASCLWIQVCRCYVCRILSKRGTDNFVVTTISILVIFDLLHFFLPAWGKISKPYNKQSHNNLHWEPFWEQSTLKYIKHFTETHFGGFQVLS